MALIKTDVSGEPIASTTRVKRISELGTTLADSYCCEPNGVTFQNTVFFIVTAMKTSNLTIFYSKFCIETVVFMLLVTANVVLRSLIFSALMMETLHSSETLDVT
jgi:hypothetical protein